MILYANWSNSPALDFLSDVQLTVDLDAWLAQLGPTEPQTKDELSAFAVRARALGCTLYVKDLTTPDMIPGSVVYKVFSPEMIPLAESHQMRWLAATRLARLAGRPVSSGFLNPVPHPFA